jgi:TPR repeat protein
VDKLADERWERASECLKKGDRAGALWLYKLLAESGDQQALVKVGEIYEIGGENLTRDYEEAAKWYRRAIFSVGDPKAHLALARMYFNKQLVSEDSPQAFERHAMAAAQHDEPLAFLMLGLMLEHKDAQKAKFYHERAATLGMVLAKKRLSVFAFRERNFVAGIKLRLEAVCEGISLARTNPDDGRLAGFRRGERRFPW